jgi:NADH-quinone oxidoreductase subunit C
MSMQDRLDDLVEAIEEQFEEAEIEFSLERALGEVSLEVDKADWSKAALLLRNHADLAFEQLIDLCAVDYLTYGQGEWNTADAPNTGFGRGVNAIVTPPGVAEADQERRFAVVCHLLSLKHNIRLRLKTFCAGDTLIVDSLTPVWNCADWFEREAFDLFGILFDGHPDLRRILTDYGFVGHPLRKDFPLSGHVEMRYDADKGRVIYEPVSIEPRTLVPRTLRSDSRYAQRSQEHEDA